MRVKSIVTLIYQGKQILDNGSPKIVTLEREAECFIEERFSQYYYRDSQREMRKSKNISIPVNLTFDLNENGVHYELLHAKLNGTKYQVKNVLKHGSTSLMAILDCQEVTQ